MAHQGHVHGLPKLDPEAGVSAIQLVGPQTSRKEIESLYYEVYKLQRLLGSPPGEPELIAKVVSSLEVCQEQERSKMPQAVREHSLADVQTMRSRAPRRREGCLCGKESCQGKGGPPEGPGHGGHLRGRDRASEPSLVRSQSEA